MAENGSCSPPVVILERTGEALTTLPLTALDFLMQALLARGKKLEPVREAGSWPQMAPRPPSLTSDPEKAHLPSRVAAAQAPSACGTAIRADT
jgi:hypothetical protein